MKDTIVMRDVEFGFADRECCPVCGRISDDIAFVMAMHPEAGYADDGLRWCPCGGIYYVSNESECDRCGQPIREVEVLRPKDFAQKYAHSLAG